MITIFKKQTIAFMFIFILALSLFSPGIAEAAKTKTGHVDIQFGALDIRSGPGTKYKVIGTAKKNAKLTIYAETKNGWAETRVNKKKGYVPVEALRFYKKMSNAEAKKITNKVVKTQYKIYDNESFTKKQAHSTMGPSFTTSYINKFIKSDTETVGKNKKGETLYQVQPIVYTKYSLWDFIWEADGYYIPHAPTVKYYVKNGKQYLYIRQAGFSEEHGIIDQKLYLSRASSKASWKVYNYSW